MTRGRALRSFVCSLGTFQAGREYEGEVVASRPNLFEAIEPGPKARAKPGPKASKVVEPLAEWSAELLPPQE